MDAMQRLENWKSGHKARSVLINHPDGYGAGCWEVQLYGQGGKQVHAAECSFWEYEPAKLPKNVVYVVGIEKEKEDEEWDWPGLAAVINAAIDRAEELGL